MRNNFKALLLVLTFFNIVYLYGFSIFVKQPTFAWLTRYHFFLAVTVTVGALGFLLELLLQFDNQLQKYFMVLYSVDYCKDFSLTSSIAQRRYKHSKKSGLTCNKKKKTCHNHNDWLYRETFLKRCEHLIGIHIILLILSINWFTDNQEQRYSEHETGIKDIKDKKLSLHRFSLRKNIFLSDYDTVLPFEDSLLCDDKFRFWCVELFTAYKLPR